MKCKEMESRAIPYLDGKLAPRQREAVELHLRSCSSCAERIRGFSEVSGLLHEWEGMELSPFFNARWERLLEQDAASAGWWESLFRRLAPLPPGSPIFAVALLAVISLAVVLVRYPPAPPERLASPEPSPAVVSLASGVDELTLYRALPVLEDWDVLRNFEVLQELSSRNP